MTSAQNIIVKINPEYEKLVPELSENDLQLLRASIKADNAIHTPIFVNKEGMRYAIIGGGILAPIDAKGKTAEKLAAVSGLSARTLEKVTAIIKKAAPESIEQLRSGKVKVDKVYKQVQKEEKRQELFTRAKKAGGGALVELPGKESCNLIQGDFISVSVAEDCKQFSRPDIYRPTI